MMIKKQKLTLICGKSGSGKDFFAKIFNLDMVISHTTRPPRQGEVHGVHKWFHKHGEESSSDIVAYTRRGEYEYWTSIYDLFDGKFYIIDPPGIIYLQNDELVKEKFDLDVVYLDCGLLKRIRNMRKRKTGWMEIFQRLLIDAQDFQLMKQIKHTTINL
jgi:guanylate kinase